MASTSATGPSRCLTHSRKILKVNGTAQRLSASWQLRTPSPRPTDPTSCLQMHHHHPVHQHQSLPHWDKGCPCQACRHLEPFLLYLPQDRCPQGCRQGCPCPQTQGDSNQMQLVQGLHLDLLPFHRAACTQECLQWVCHLMDMDLPEWYHRPLLHQVLTSTGHHHHLACRHTVTHRWACHPEDHMAMVPQWVIPCIRV